MSHRPRPAFLIVLLVPVIAVLIVAGYLLVIALTDDSDPAPIPEQTPEPTEISLVSSPEADEGTPDAEDLNPAAGSLSDLMAYAPDRLNDGSLPLPEVATYTDLDRWLMSQGSPAGSLTESQAASVALPAILAGRGLDPEWKSTYGFSLADVDQILAIGQAPDYIMIMRGTFDTDALMNAWTSGAYQAVEVDGVTVWSVHPFETDAVDLSNPSSRLAMGSFNNLVLLEDGTLIATAKFSRLRSVINVVNGGEPSMAENADIASLLTLERSDRAYLSAVIAKGEFLESAPVDTRTSNPTETFTTQTVTSIATPGPNDMPEIRMALFGLMIENKDRASTPVATPEVKIQPELTIALVVADRVPDQMMTAIESRFATEISSTSGLAFGSTWKLVAPSPMADSGMLELGLIPLSSTFDWLRLVDNRDFGFLTWSEADD